MEKMIEKIAQDIAQMCPNLAEDCCGDINCATCLSKGLIKQGYRKQEWISVDDRLPINDYEKHWKDRNYYLVYTEPSGLMYVATFGFKEYDWWISNPDMVLSQVTHYMPLPTPPKMKGVE